jgi:hypothetical protein
MTEGGFFAENLAYMQNLIDWVNLDSDLTGIRSRGAAARRLERIEPRSQAAIEALNYAVPLGLLLALAGYHLWKRRSAEPVAGGPPSASSSGGERSDA